LTNKIKRNWIRDAVAGKTFADIGGLGGESINEMVTAAMESGASEATMVDVLPERHPLWQSFRDVCARKGIAGYKTLVADLNDMETRFDVVHCSGILYHVPDPIHTLWQLRKLTKETLILTSATVPAVVENEKGRAAMTPGTAVFVPALSGRELGIYARHFEKLGMRIEFLDGSTPQWISNAFTTVNYGPWWWLFTEDYIHRMLEVCGLRVIAKQETWPERGWSFLCGLA
jgi:hypothetical protein